MRFGEIKENAGVGTSFLRVDGTSFGRSWVRQSCDKSLKLTEPESDEETPRLFLFIWICFDIFVIVGINLGVFCDVVADHRNRTVQPVENRSFTMSFHNQDDPDQRTRPQKITKLDIKSNKDTQHVLNIFPTLDCNVFHAQIVPAVVDKLY